MNHCVALWDICDDISKNFLLLDTEISKETDLFETTSESESELPLSASITQPRPFAPINPFDADLNSKIQIPLASLFPSKSGLEKLNLP